MRKRLIPGAEDDDDSRGHAAEDRLLLSRSLRDDNLPPPHPPPSWHLSEATESSLFLSPTPKKALPAGEEGATRDLRLTWPKAHLRRHLQRGEHLTLGTDSLRQRHRS